MVCLWTSGFYFIIWGYFKLTAKGLNIRHQLPHWMSIPRRFIIIIIIIVIIIIIITSAIDTIIINLLSLLLLALLLLLSNDYLYKVA